MSETTTPYNAAKAVNSVLAELEILETSEKSKNFGNVKVLPPQMFYNYTTSRIREGKAPLIACDDDGRIIVESLTEWTRKYVQKLQDKKVESVPVLAI